MKILSLIGWLALSACNDRTSPEAAVEAALIGKFSGANGRVEFFRDHTFTWDGKSGTWVMLASDRVKLTQKHGDLIVLEGVRVAGGLLSYRDNGEEGGIAYLARP